MQLLLVDDDPTLVEAIVRGLGPGFQVDSADTENDACAKVKKNTYDLLLVDELLPQGSGLGVIRFTRQLSTELPIVMITANASKSLAIACVNLGVNHFLEKPFEFGDLQAQLEKLRPMPHPFEIATDWVYRPDRRRIEYRGEAAKLTPIEFRIVEFLIRQRGRCVSRDELVRGVWGSAQVSGHTLDTHMSSLRRKAKPVGACIKISRGRGYWWDANNNV